MSTTITPEHERLRASTGVRGLWWKAATGIWASLTILIGYLRVGPVLDPEGKPMFTSGGHGAKLIFFHVPCPWIATVAYIVAAVYAVRYLIRGKGQGWARACEDDFKCATAMELGLLFAVLATVTGMIFSHNEWGAYWSWDPRQTSILVLLLIYSAYLVLRGAVEDPERRGRLSSVYALVAVVPGVFLIWIVPLIVQTLHPQMIVIKGQISGSYRPVLYGFAVPSFIGIFVWLFQLRLRVFKLSARRESVELRA